jgi:HD-like signal output (HDOD) protein
MTGSDGDTMPHDSLSPEAEAFVRAVGAASNLPMFVQNVRAIGQMASNLDARVALLEKAIVQDVTLTAKVLKIANALTGSPGGDPSSRQQITSVKQAIMLLGYDRVHYLSSASSVFRQIEQDSPAVNDLLVESVLTATHGLQLSLAAGWAKPELAYLCGLFRRLGEVLVACYRPQHYLLWLERSRSEQTPREGDEAAVFAFTFEEVGVALARRWGMPPDVARTMRPYRGVADGDATLHMITQCSAEVTRAQFGAVSSGSDEALAALRADWAHRLSLSVQEITDLQEVVMQEAGPTLRAMRVDVDTWVRGRRDLQDVARVRREQHTAGAGDSDLDAEGLVRLGEELMSREDDTVTEARLRAAVLALVERRQDTAAPNDVGLVTQATLRAAHEAGFERGVLAISSEDFKFVRGRVGFGQGSTELVRSFVARPSATFGPVGAALQSRTDLFVQLTGADGKLYGRDRLVREFNPSQFVLLPLVLEDRLLGCLYFDSIHESIEATDTSRRLMQHLRDQLVAAFARHRASTGGPTAANGA